jgi:hypothetical protein
MTARRLRQIWQFGVGKVFAIVGLVALIGFVGVNYLLPPPSFEKLRHVSGVLTGSVMVQSPSRGEATWASLPIRTAKGIVVTRIDNCNFLWGGEENPPLLKLRTGDEITIWLAINGVAWQIQHDGASLLTFEQALAARHESEMRYLYLWGGLLCIGIVLSFWGWCIYVVEHR